MASARLIADDVEINIVHREQDTVDHYKLVKAIARAVRAYDAQNPSTSVSSLATLLVAELREKS